jgi:hypothetical protein
MQSHFGEICDVRLILLRLKMGTFAAAAKWSELYFDKGRGGGGHARAISEKPA